jgi:hypothetical protein
MFGIVIKLGIIYIGLILLPVSQICSGHVRKIHIIKRIICSMTLILCKYVEYSYTFARRLIIEIVYKKQRELPCREIIIIIIIM